MANTPMIDVPELSGVAGLTWSMADQAASDKTITTTLKGKADYGALFNNDILQSLREQRVGAYGWYSGHSVRHGYGRQFDEIELTAVELTVNYNISNYYSYFEATSRTESRPLEEKTTKIGANDETYALWWNHDIRGVNTLDDIEAPEQSLLKAVTKRSQGVAPGLISNDYRWCQSNQALAKGEKVFMDARYPGVQSYGVGALQVKEIVYSRKFDNIKAIMDSVGYMYPPIDSAGNYYDNSVNGKDATKWLITSASYQKRLGWFEAQLTYAFAKGGWLEVGAVSPNTGVYPTWSA